MPESTNNNYIIGYGSYLNEEERIREGMNDYVKAVIKGYRRVFNKVTESGRWPRIENRLGVMNVEESTDPNDKLNVVAMRVSDELMETSHRREGSSEHNDIVHYEVVEVDFYDFPNAENRIGRGVMYIAPGHMTRRDIFPVSRYYHVCRDGAKSLGPDFLKMYDQTTIVQWNGARLTVEALRRLNARIPRDMGLTKFNHPQLETAFKTILNGKYVTEDHRYAGNMGIIESVNFDDFNVDNVELFDLLLWLDTRGHHAGWGIPSKNQIGSISPLRKNRKRFSINLTRLLLKNKYFLYRVLAHEFLGHLDAHAEPMSLRFKSTESQHDLCDQEADKFITGLVMNGEILESFEKRSEKFPRLRIVEGNRVADVPHDSNVPDTEVFDFSYTPENEIFIRPFAKMNRIDGEILIRRQKLKLTPDWDQWVWKVSKFDRRSKNLYTYFKLEFEVPQLVYNKILVYARDMRKRTQKIKYFDDGTEYIYLSTPNFNFIPITASFENVAPSLENVTIYRPDRTLPHIITSNLSVSTNDFPAFVESCLNTVRELQDSERFLRLTIQGNEYRMYQDEERNVFIFVPVANMWLKIGNVNQTEN